MQLEWNMICFIVWIFLKIIARIVETNRRERKIKIFETKTCADYFDDESISTVKFEECATYAFHEKNF